MGKTLKVYDIKKMRKDATEKKRRKEMIADFNYVQQQQNEMNEQMKGELDKLNHMAVDEQKAFIDNEVLPYIESGSGGEIPEHIKDYYNRMSSALGIIIDRFEVMKNIAINPEFSDETGTADEKKMFIMINEHRKKMVDFKTTMDEQNKKRCDESDEEFVELSVIDPMIVFSIDTIKGKFKFVAKYFSWVLSLNIDEIGIYLISKFALWVIKPENNCFIDEVESI